VQSKSRVRVSEEISRSQMKISFLKDFFREKGKLADVTITSARLQQRLVELRYFSQ